MKILVPFVLLMLAATSAQADLLLPGDAGRGEKLHQANCTGCHDTGVYTRTNRGIRSIGGLQQRVDMCNTQLERNLSDAERSDVVKYLNERFYRFQ
jgi:mono/diheme cytochrome c family protein